MTSWTPGRALMLLICGLLGWCEASGASLKYDLQHSFGLEQPFNLRGQFEIEIGETGLLASPSADTFDLPAELISDVERSTRAGDLYRIRAQLVGGGPSLMTAVPLCDVVRAGFRENITVNVNVDGKVISLDYTPRMSRLSPHTCAAIKSLENVQFVTAVEVAVDKPAQSVPPLAPGPRPPGIHIKVDEHERPPPPPQSFLQKYWIFIVLAVLLFNTGTGGDPAQEGGGGGDGGGGAQAAPAGGPGAAGGGGAVRRR